MLRVVEKQPLQKRSQQQTIILTPLVHLSFVYPWQERSRSMTGVGGREELRGLGQELIRLDIRFCEGPDPWDEATLYKCAWTKLLSSIVSVVDRALHDALAPYNNAALVESHAEKLLDLVIRFASEQQWKCWLETSLRIASYLGATEVLLRLLASYEAHPDDSTLRKILVYAWPRQRVEILSALIDVGGGPMGLAVDKLRWPIAALHWAAQVGHQSLMARLIEAGAPINARNGMGGTALTYATYHDHKVVVRQLLAAGADVNKAQSHTDNGGTRLNWFRGHTPLCIATASNDQEMVEILLDAGADPNKGPGTHRPLLNAAFHGRCVILSSLLSAGANVNYVLDDGSSALHWACAKRHRDAVGILLRHNASTTLLNRRGLSPMDYLVVGVHDNSWYFTRCIPQRPLDSAETSTVAEIRGMLQSARSWRCRGWLVMLRSRALAHVVEQRTRCDLDRITQYVETACLVEDPSSHRAALGGENGKRRALHYSSHTNTEWSDAVVWTLHGPDEGLFSNILRFL